MNQDNNNRRRNREHADEDEEQDDHQQRRKQNHNQQQNRALLLSFACAYTFLYVGAFFGWGPMQLLLEQSGAFASKCNNGAAAAAADSVCPAQTAALLRVQMIAQTTQVFSPLLGQVADQCGAPMSVYMMSCCAWVGIGLLVVATQYQLDHLLYVAFAGLAFATWNGGLLTVQTGLYFAPGQDRSRVIFALNALFDAGSITYLGLWGIGQATGASITTLAIGYLGLAVVLFGGGSYYWSVTAPVEALETTSELVTSLKIGTEEEEENVTKPSTISTHHNVSGVNQVVHDGKDPLESDGEKPGILDSALAQDVEVSSMDGMTTLQGSPPSEQVRQERRNATDSYIIVANRTARQQLTCYPAILLAVFFALHVTGNQWTLTTTRDFLAYLGDNELHHRYLTIFTLCMPASLAALPLLDAMIGHVGFYGAFQCTNVLALSYLLIRITTNNLHVQILGFLLFAFFRCFLFGVTFSYLPTLLAPRVTGKAAGLLYMVTGITAFVNIPLANLAVQQLDGNFFFPNLFYTLLVIPCIVCAHGIGQSMQREHQAKHAATCEDDVDGDTEERLRMSWGGVLLRKASRRR